MSGSKPLHIDPALHDRTAAECMEAHHRGNHVQALTLSMMAGIDAGVMGMAVADCPRAIADRLELFLRWMWGRDVARTTNENNKQLGLI